MPCPAGVGKPFGHVSTGKKSRETKTGQAALVLQKSCRIFGASRKTYVILSEACGSLEGATRTPDQSGLPPDGGMP